MVIGYKDKNGNIVQTKNVGSTIQVETMPTASASNLNFIYQYIGTTNANYTNGFFYKCVSNGQIPPTYSWANIDVQFSSGGQTIQVNTLPVASASELYNIYQYIGADTLTLKNGFFYKCVSDGQDPATYSWVQADTQPTTPIATEEIVGKVKPDGETITIDPDGTIHALGGGGGIRLGNVSGATATSVKEVVYLKWSDPADVVVSEIPLAQWAGTKVLRKVDAAPTGIDDEDAVLILDSTVRNAYASVPLEDNTVEYGVQYYYKFFPYTVDELYTNGSAVGIVPHRVVIENVPSQSGRLEYSGASQSPTWNNYDSDKLTIGGVTSGTAVGTYTATFTPKSDYMWEDGTQDTIDVTWKINNITISNYPSVSGTLTYNGQAQSPTWTNYNSEQLTIGGDTSATNVGTYSATFTPKTNYEWSDGTTDAYSVEWSINNIVINTVPSVVGTLTYTGSELTPTWNNYNSEQLTMSGDTSGTNVGSYTTIFTPKPNYEWADGTQDPVSVTWVISSIIIAAVPTQQGVLVYTGTEQSPTWSGYDSNTMTISGDTAATNIGTYTATFTPKANCQWWDGTTTGKTADWSIGEITITTVPSQQGALTYNGSEQTAVWNNFDTDQLTVTGNTATNAGTYTASFTPKIGYKWSDNTTTAKTASWTIDKATGGVTLSTNNITLDSTTTSATVTVTNATGDITVTSSNSTVATASYSNGVITIESPNEKRGSAIITVDVAGNSNYLATSASINVFADYISIKEWKDGENQATDAEVAAMVAAADAGTIDLSVYWAVGDERTVHLAAIPVGNAFFQGVAEQDVKFVLMNVGYSGTGNENINFVWGQKSALTYSVKLAKDWVVTTWKDCELRTELNSLYYNAIPETLRNCMKQFNVITADTPEGTTLNTTQEYISNFAVKEVLGSEPSNPSYPLRDNPTESEALEEIEWYKTTSNRGKTIGNVTGGNAAIWFTRSIDRYGYQGKAFCSISGWGGNCSYTSNGSSDQVAPVGCI